MPMGHALMGGGIAPARSVDDPLEAVGLVLSGPGQPPIVVVSVDWCEIRNDAYERWRSALAEAAGTEPGRVLVTAVHVHDAPVADLAAEEVLRANGCVGSVCDPDFHEVAVSRVADALRDALAAGGDPVTHLGFGGAEVRQVGSNRRYPRSDGSISFGRTSACRDPDAHAAPEGLIDPQLKALTFFAGDRALLTVSCYAVHPMSHYGAGAVSADFPGLARRARQAATPGTTQIYVSGCSGNVTCGKYNDGAPAMRAVLASRLEAAMTEAAGVAAGRRTPLERAQLRTVPMTFTPREGDGFSAEELAARLTGDPTPFGQCLAALGLSWRARLDAGTPVDLPVVDFGPALLALLPGEAYVEFQLLAQQLRPDAWVMAIGYGEAGGGYIPTARHVAEGDHNLDDWSWVDPSAEGVLAEALGQVLAQSARTS
jgi:hypothetical protein